MFHSKPLPQFDFTAHNDPPAIAEAFGQFTYPTDKLHGTATGRALNFVANSLLTPSAGHRTGGDVQTVVLVVTDGKSQESDSVVAEAAATLHAMSSSVIVLGISDQVNPAQLNTIAGAGGSVFLQSDFEQLGPEVVAQLGFAALCPSEATTTTSTTTVAATTADPSEQCILLEDACETTSFGFSGGRFLPLFGLPSTCWHSQAHTGCLFRSMYSKVVNSACVQRRFGIGCV